MHYLDANKTAGEEARRQLHKNKSWRQHPTRHQLYGHLPPITKTIQVRRTRHAGHCWRSKDELISDVLLWTPIYGQAKAGWPARIYIQQLCEDTGCSPEDLPEAMNDREKWRERVRNIRTRGTTWWWWWWLYFKYIKDVRLTVLNNMISAFFFCLNMYISCMNLLFFKLFSYRKWEKSESWKFLHMEAWNTFSFHQRC